MVKPRRIQPITDADRLAALLALAYATPPVSERVIADVAQAIADARDGENKACELAARERYATAEAALVARRRAGQLSNDVDTGLWWKRDEADLIADLIAARRPR